MSNIPPPSNKGSAFRQEMQDLLQSIQTLVRITNTQKEVLQNQRTILGQNTLAVANLTRTFSNYGIVVTNLVNTFKKADKLQEKALSIGTSTSNFLKENNKTLKGLRGDFFDNAEDLLENYSTGIRENSDSVNLLMNRMKLTGQSTEVLRGAIGQLSIITGGSMDAAGRLAKTNIELGRTYGVSNEALIASINSLNSTLSVPSFLGLGEGVADLAQSLTAAAGPKASAQIQKSLELLLDPKFLETRFALGIGRAEDILTNPALKTNERLGLAIDFLRQANSRLDQLTSNTKGSLKISMTSQQLDAIGNQDSLIAAKQLYNVLNYQGNITNKLVTSQDNYFETFKTAQDEARNFYSNASPAYEAIVKYLPLMAAGSIGGNLGSVAGGLIGSIGGRASAMRLGAVLGPVGAAVGGLLAFLPDISNYLSKSNDLDKKQLETLKSIDGKTPQLPTGSMPNQSSGNFSEFIANTVRSIVTEGSGGSRSLSELEQMKMILAEIRNSLANNKGNIPSSYKTNF